MGVRGGADKSHQSISAQHLIKKSGKLGTLTRSLLLLKTGILAQTDQNIMCKMVPLDCIERVEHDPATGRVLMKNTAPYQDWEFVFQNANFADFFAQINAIRAEVPGPRTLELHSPITTRAVKKPKMSGTAMRGTLMSYPADRQKKKAAAAIEARFISRHGDMGDDILPPQLPPPTTMLDEFAAAKPVHKPSEASSENAACEADVSETPPTPGAPAPAALPQPPRSPWMKSKIYDARGAPCLETLTHHDILMVCHVNSEFNDSPPASSPRRVSPFAARPANPWQAASMQQV